MKREFESAMISIDAEDLLCKKLLATDLEHCQICFPFDNLGLRYWIIFVRLYNEERRYFQSRVHSIRSSAKAICHKCYSEVVWFIKWIFQRENNFLSESMSQNALADVLAIHVAENERGPCATLLELCSVSSSLSFSCFLRWQNKFLQHAWTRMRAAAAAGASRDKNNLWQSFT